MRELWGGRGVEQRTWPRTATSGRGANAAGGGRSLQPRTLVSERLKRNERLIWRGGGVLYRL